jgi:hypothetical protein
MSLPGFDETLIRFGLEALKSRVDLQVSKSDDIAVTRDGILQMGNAQVNGLFRLVERWRRSESTISDLFSLQIMHLALAHSSSIPVCATISSMIRLRWGTPACVSTLIFTLAAKPKGPMLPFR